MQPTDSLDELRKRAAKYMQLEELREFRNQACAEASGEKNKRRKTAKGGRVKEMTDVETTWTDRSGSQNTHP